MAQARLSGAAARTRFILESHLRRGSDDAGSSETLALLETRYVAAQYDSDQNLAVASENTAPIVTAARRLPFYCSRGALETPGVGISATEFVEGFASLTKEDLRTVAPDLLRHAPAAVTCHLSSGTSGPSVKIARPRRVRAHRAALDRRLFNTLGMPPFFELVIVVPWRQSALHQWGLHDWRVKVSSVSLRDVVAAWRPASHKVLYVAMPSVCELLKPRIEGPIVSAFELPPNQRGVAFAEAGDTAIRLPTQSEFYGASELSAPIAFRFPDCSHLHVNNDAVHVEILAIDRDVRMPPLVAGEIVVTDLLNDAMPIIRYRLGDVGVIDPIRCGCGRVTPRLTLLGRIGTVGARREAPVEYLGRRSGQLVVQTAADEFVGVGERPNELAAVQEAARHNGVTVDWRTELPVRLMHLAATVPCVSVTERLPLERCLDQPVEQLVGEGLMTSERLTWPQSASRPHQTGAGTRSVLVVNSGSMHPLVRSTCTARVNAPASEPVPGQVAVIEGPNGLLLTHRVVATRVTRAGTSILQMADHAGPFSSFNASWIDVSRVAGIVSRMDDHEARRIYDAGHLVFRCADRVIAWLGHARWLVEKGWPRVGRPAGALLQQARQGVAWSAVHVWGRVCATEETPSTT